jgi:hypothetical protein
LAWWKNEGFRRLIKTGITSLDYEFRTEGATVQNAAKERNRVNSTLVFRNSDMG